MYDPIRSSVNKLQKLIPELKYNITIIFDHSFDGYNYNEDYIYLKSYKKYKLELNKNDKYYFQILPIKQLLINIFGKFNLKLYCYYSILHDYMNIDIIIFITIEEIFSN